MARDPERKGEKKTGQGQRESWGDIYAAAPTYIQPRSPGLPSPLLFLLGEGVRPASGAARRFSNQTPQAGATYAT